MEKDSTILIVDDVDINRTLLSEIFKEDYNIIEAEGGEQAINIINQSENSISAVLLDLMMPGVSGLDVLRAMNESGKIQVVPVFLITAADSTELLQEGYNLGAIDVIAKPFIPNFLRCRVNNVIELYRHRNELEVIVDEQVERLNNLNRSLVETMATIIEFRDCESGEHVRRIRGLTKILMNNIGRLYPEYRMSKEEIRKITLASVLHDVGKISIPDNILNKPGRLTPEEFEIMKGHTIKGCEILKNIPHILDKDVYEYSYDICRHHHERWDGNGYPDRLCGDDITIWSQVVSVVDVYDALTAKRVYKDALSHETAVDMIFNGKCGVFNPKVLKAFEASFDEIIAKH